MNVITGLKLAKNIDGYTKGAIAPKITYFFSSQKL
jgi:hypothetical protein